MKISRTLMNTALACSLFSGSMLVPARALQVSAQSLGYELSEEDLAGEMLAGSQTDLVQQPAPSIDPEDFEAIYDCFLS